MTDEGKRFFAGSGVVMKVLKLTLLMARLLFA